MKFVQRMTLLFPGIYNDNTFLAIAILRNLESNCYVEKLANAY
jgi:hypothetical protein